MPNEIVQTWLVEHGVDGARLLARHVPPPFLGSDGPELHPITYFLMEKFGDDDVVFSSFVAGIHSGGVFAGRISDWVTRGAAMAEQFVAFPIPSIRRWAHGEIDSATQQVFEFRMQEEEDWFS
jgi:hypothetical protein